MNFLYAISSQKSYLPIKIFLKAIDIRCWCGINLTLVGFNLFSLLVMTVFLLFFVFFKIRFQMGWVLCFLWHSCCCMGSITSPHSESKLQDDNNNQAAKVSWTCLKWLCLEIQGRQQAPPHFTMVIMVVLKSMEHDDAFALSTTIRSSSIDPVTYKRSSFIQPLNRFSFQLDIYRPYIP